MTLFTESRHPVPEQSREAGRHVDPDRDASGEVIGSVELALFAARRQLIEPRVGRLGDAQEIQQRQQALEALAVLRSEAAGLGDAEAPALMATAHMLARRASEAELDGFRINSADRITQTQALANTAKQMLAAISEMVYHQTGVQPTLQTRHWNPDPGRNHEVETAHLTTGMMMLELGPEDHASRVPLWRDDTGKLWLGDAQHLLPVGESPVSYGRTQMRSGCSETVSLQHVWLRDVPPDGVEIRPAATKSGTAYTSVEYPPPSKVAADRAQDALDQARSAFDQLEPLKPDPTS
jgi:hypothetical protein